MKAKLLPSMKKGWLPKDDLEHEEFSQNHGFSQEKLKSQLIELDKSSEDLQSAFHFFEYQLQAAQRDNSKRLSVFIQDSELALELQRKMVTLQHLKLEELGISKSPGSNSRGTLDGQDQGNQNLQDILDSIIDEIKKIVMDCKSEFPDYSTRIT
ncbi:hypothetical protein PGT21_008712 [Puccinia graminis f. sp. tritici]|uniref:Uncharacterized protein n=1 Tax=Puccinia graminis f. sp. tritici TaxID=56615 RepID=A0A5B0N852_PUCGR|nr:hypothetical protein PGT21_008712 [Puccinia graminis f. sp. tritici]